MKIKIRRELNYEYFSSFVEIRFSCGLVVYQSEIPGWVLVSDIELAIQVAILYLCLFGNIVNDMFPSECNTTHCFANKNLAYWCGIFFKLKILMQTYVI